MAAMKPRTGDGPLEVTKEGRGLVMRVPLEGGGRLVVELSAEEHAVAADLFVRLGERDRTCNDNPMLNSSSRAHQRLVSGPSRASTRA